MEAFDRKALFDALAAASRPDEREQDFRDENGLLVCGVCGETRERIATVADMGNEVQFIVGRECACMRKEREEREAAEEARKERESLIRLRKMSLMDKRMSETRFSNTVVLSGNEKAVKLAKRYVEKWDDALKSNNGLLFYGPPGTGKSHLAACIANELLDRGVPVMMTSCIRLTDMILHSEDGEGEILRRMNRAKLLILDDLGSERDTSYSLEKVYSIIDSRYRSCLPIIVTTNLKADDLFKEEDPNKGRIYSRVLEMCYPIELKEFDFRKALASKKKKEMEIFLEGE